jgi:hypothetical protein
MQLCLVRDALYGGILVGGIVFYYFWFSLQESAADYLRG